LITFVNKPGEEMKFIRHAAILCIALASGFSSIALQAQTTQTAQAQTAASIIGQWNFETATGTTRTGNEEVDIMSKGVMHIAQKGQGLVANIAWFNERGEVQSLRQMEGSLVNSTVNGAAVFSHSGTRTHTSPRGKETSTEVKVIWTLQATDKVLSGTRQVAFGEDAAKPVSGTRSASLIMPTAVTATNPVERGPSTQEERARVLQMALDSEKNPLQIQATNAEWLKKWVNDVPDLTLNYGAVSDWLGRAAKQESREAIKFQFTASVMAFQIKNPALANTQSANDLAGVEGVLRAYETLVSQDDKHRSVKMDSVLAARNKSELPAFLKSLSGRD
jgi:carboxypeptidase Q